MEVVFITVAFSVRVRMRVSMTMSIFVILIQLELSCRSVRNVIRLFVFGVFVLIFWYQEFLRFFTLFLGTWFWIGFFLGGLLRFWIWWSSLRTQISFTALIYFSYISFRFDRLLSIVEISGTALRNGRRLLRFDRLLALSLRVLTIFNCWLLHHCSLDVLMIFLDLCIAWIPLRLWCNVKKSFRLCFELSESFQLSPVVLEILLLSQLSLHISFLFIFHLLALLEIGVVLIHVPLLQLFGVLHSSLDSFLVFDLILFKLVLQFYLLLLNKFNLHWKFEFFVLGYFICLCLSFSV